MPSDDVLEVRQGCKVNGFYRKPSHRFDLHLRRREGQLWQVTETSCTTIIILTLISCFIFLVS